MSSFVATVQKSKTHEIVVLDDEFATDELQDWARDWKVPVCTESSVTKDLKKTSLVRGTKRWLCWSYLDVGAVALRGGSGR